MKTVEYKNKKYDIYDIKEPECEERLLLIDKRYKSRYDTLKGWHKSHQIMFTPDNILYKEEDSIFFSSVMFYYNDGYFEGRGREIYASNTKPIICSCGCDEFSLQYGSYSLDAKCLNCGIEDTVYSG
jgi:hypothetical protein